LRKLGANFSYSPSITATLAFETIVSNPSNILPVKLIELIHFDLSRSAINVPTRYMIANIALDDGLILPRSANPTGSNFRERQVGVSSCGR